MEILISHMNLLTILVGLLITGGLYRQYRHTESRQLLNYIPNVWTSLGILGTFCCIVYALSPHGGKTINWNDINTLVKNIIPAFGTSIIGIIGAIATSVIAKIIFANEDKEEAEAYKRQYDGTPEQYIGAICQQIHETNKKLGVNPVSASEGLLEKIDLLLAVSKEQNATLIEETKAQHLLVEKMTTDFTENLKEFYSTTYKEEKLHMQELTEQYLSGINEIIKATHGTIKEKFETLFTVHADSLKKLMESEKAQLTLLSDNITASINESVDGVKLAISETGVTLAEEVKGIAINTKQQLQTLTEDNKQAVSVIVEDNQTAISSLSSEIERNIGNISSEFLLLISSLKTQFEELAKNLPTEIMSLKQQLLDIIKQITEEKYNALSEDNKKFVAQLLAKVEDYQENITILSHQSQTEWLNAINTELSKLLNRMDVNVTNNTAKLEDATKNIGDNLAGISDTLKTATKDYDLLAAQINTLVTALQKETDATEAYSNSVTTTNTQLSAIQNLISDVINKNLQLRQELAQWKRTHKHVKVNIETGMKECPNCYTENPNDASFCRRCATSFWQCEPIKIESTMKVAKE